MSDTSGDWAVYSDQRSTPFRLGGQIEGRDPCYVYRAKAKSDKGRKHPFVQKIIKIESDPGALEAAKREFIEEVKILRQAQHFHVTQFIDAFEIRQEKTQFALVMGAAKEDISRFLQGKVTSTRTIESMRQWFYCLAGVIEYIHGLGIRHRDIKPKNILVGNTGEVLLADFGISRMGIIQTLSTTIPKWARSRSSSHCAPEVENGSSRGRSADIFSLGCIFLELLMACYDSPDQITDLANLITDKQTGEKSYAEHVKGLGPWMESFERTHSENLDDLGRGVLALCQSMLREDRDARPRALEVLEKLRQLQPLSPEPNKSCNCQNASTLTGNPALVEACKAGLYTKVIELVKSHQAQPSATGALHQAAARNHASIVEYLLGHDSVQVDVKDLSKQTALHCAASNGYVEMVDLLLSRGATATIMDVEGRTALHYAAGHGRADIVQRLLTRGGANVAIEDQDGQTALHFAAKRGHTAEVQILLNQLPSGNERKNYADKFDRRQQTALHFAAAYGSHEVIEELLKVNTDIHARDLRGWTALHFAARGRDVDGGCENVCKVLLDAGVPVEARDKNQQTACWDAHPSVQDLLGKAMGSMPKDSKVGNETQTQLSILLKDGEMAGGNLPADFHPDFLSFITISQYHKVDIWPLVWDENLDILGKGATGDVRQAMINLESQFAFKRFVSHRSTRVLNTESSTSAVYQSNEKLFMALISELVILNQPDIKRHEHIVDIEGIAFDVEASTQSSVEVWPLLVMKKAQHGSLVRYMSSEDGKNVDFSSKLKFCAQIGSAIYAMHSNNIVHGDIKPQNILMYDNNQEVIAKVTDFSYSCLRKSEVDIVTLPRYELWQAPEYDPRGCNLGDAKLMDIYSFGMVCFWLLFPLEFGDIAINRENCTDIRAAAENLASKQGSLKPLDRQFLAKFFASTLCGDPKERNKDWPELVWLLGQRLWQPDDEEEFFGGRRLLTFADYGATIHDIQSPERLRALTSRIFNSLHLAGKDYDIMRERLDSTKFTDKQRTEKYINFVLEEVSKFRFSSLERDEEVRAQLVHSCLNIPLAFYQLISVDYRIRVYIVQCLRERANGSCEKCAKSAALELAFCYVLGFGIVSDATASQHWLTRSGSNIDQLRERLEYLRNLEIRDIETTTHVRSIHKGLFSISFHDRYGSENFHAAESHISREIQDLERQLGVEHWQLLHLKNELIELLSAQNKSKEATIMTEVYRLSIQEKYGTENVFHALIMLVLGNLYKRQNRWDEAETLLLDAKRILTESYNSNHYICLQVCEALAITYTERGKNAEAEKEFQQILQASQRTLHTQHPFATIVTWRYAALLERQGRLTEARNLKSQYYRKSSMPRDLMRLYEAHDKGRDDLLRGDLNLAEDELFEVKRETEMLLETHDLQAASKFQILAIVATRGLAVVLRKKERFMEAEALLRGLKNKMEKEFCELKLGILHITFDLARILQIQRKWTDAEKLQLAVKSGLEGLLSRTHEDTVLSSRSLAQTYEAQHKLEEAEKERKFIREACMTRLGPRHIDSIRATQILAQTYLKQGKLDLAEEGFAEAALLYDDVQGPNYEYTLGAWSNLGLVYILQKRLREGTELLEHTLEKMRNHLHNGHQIMKITTHHLVYAYNKQRKFDEVIKLARSVGHSRIKLHIKPLSEDEQIQLALELSRRAEPEAPADQAGNEGNEDLQRAAAMSLEQQPPL